MRLIALSLKTHQNLKSPGVLQRCKSDLFDSHMNYEKIMWYNFALNCKYFSWKISSYEKIGKLTINKIELGDTLLNLNDNSPVSNHTNQNKKFGSLIEKINYLWKMHVKCWYDVSWGLTLSQLVLKAKLDLGMLTHKCSSWNSKNKKTTNLWTSIWHRCRRL